MRGRAHGGAVGPFRPVVGSYELPTLCSWGRDEKLVPIAAGEWLVAHQPADLHVFERSGHCPMWEEPELWNQVVGDWIAARWSGGRSWCDNPPENHDLGGVPWRR